MRRFARPFVGFNAFMPCNNSVKKSAAGIRMSSAGSQQLFMSLISL